MENKNIVNRPRYKDIDIIDPLHHVYLAKDLNTGEYFVKKVLDIYNIDIYRYLRGHIIEGVPRVFEYSEEDGQLTVIEELINGRQLSEMMEKNEVSAGDVPYFMLQLCGILEKLHSAFPPVVHRDIKPSNIIIDDHGKVHLIDFNASKFYKDRDSSDTVLLGTMGYAAPEQFGFQSSSPQTDIFSLGKVLGELTDAAPGKWDFSPLIRKCTEMDPEERYQSVADLRADIAETAGIPGYEYISHKRHSIKEMLLKVPGFRSRTPWKSAVAMVFY
ncbi:MAG: serine/threonine protein kinase, partial [Candidatus Weimeria sp.]